MWLLIGIRTTHPDKNGIKGSPDNLWAIDNLEYFVIECKNGVKPDTTAVSKTDCSQLLSSIRWFENLYAGNGFKCYPVSYTEPVRFLMPRLLMPSI